MASMDGNAAIVTGAAWAVVKDVTAKQLRTRAAAAFAVACAVSVAAPASAAAGVAAGKASTAAVSGAVLPTSTSWPTPQIGMTLAYPAYTPEAKPSLLLTLNGGHNWLRLPPPPMPFPTDQNLPQLAFGDGVIAVTNGTQVQSSHDAGAHWSQVHLSGVSSTGGTRLFTGDLTITRGRMLALVTQFKGTQGVAAVYAGAASGTRMTPVPGLAEAGGEVYGSISAAGGLQAALGSDYQNERYWYARSGSTFTAAQLPCPATRVPLLGGVRDGTPVALCAESPSTVAPGETLAQVYTAPRLGGRFSASGKDTPVPNPQRFAAASGRDMALAAAPGLGATFNAGGSWVPVVKTPAGSFWNSLAFVSPTVGVAVGSTITQSSQLVSHVYRTTNAGRRWTALTLP